jgi:hypothetical protein
MPEAPGWLSKRAGSQKQNSGDNNDTRQSQSSGRVGKAAVEKPVVKLTKDEIELRKFCLDMAVLRNTRLNKSTLDDVFSDAVEMYNHIMVP